jgi:NAD(P)-dependent dehydrogenase (short-subunit alcohol dehydrogenase family)
MTLPRMKPQDGVAWVTGASSGVGEAVALELARRGWTVAITARRLEQLEDIARRAEGLPGRIVAHAGDVTDMASMQAVVDGVESVHGPIALAFLNAGISLGIQARALDIGAVEKTFAVNLLGLAKGLSAVMDRMSQRRRGQIVVNASVAGYRGVPGSAPYGASKAAAIHLCESVKFDCDRLGIRLQVVNHGFVDTPLTRKNRFSMPFLMAPDEAARRIVDGFARGGFAIAFPRRLAWPMAITRLLPYPIYFWLMARTAKAGGGDQRS